MANPVPLPEPRNLPAHLRDPFMHWRSERSSAHRRFGDVHSVKGATTTAAAIKAHTEAAIAAWNDASAAWWRVQADVTRPDAGRLVLGAKHLRGKLDPPRKALEAAREEAAAELVEVRGRLDRKLQTADPTQATLDAELRAHLRSLPHAERGPLVRADVRYAAAIARAPAQLSGASEKLHAEAVNAYLGDAATDDMVALIDLSAAEQCARESLAALAGLPREIGCDFKRADELAAASQAVEAA